MVIESSNTQTSVLLHYYKAIIICKGGKRTDILEGVAFVSSALLNLFKRRLPLIELRYSAKEMFDHYQKCWGRGSSLIVTSCFSVCSISPTWVFSSHHSIAIEVPSAL